MLLCCGALVGAPPALGKDTKRADEKLKRLVNEAIDRGAAWLRKRQRQDGSFPSLHERAFPMGPTALGLLTLLHCGEDPRGDAAGKAIEYLRTCYRKQKKGALRTYSVSLTVMALVTWGRRLGERRGGFFLEERDLTWLREMTRWLVETQTPAGAWHYPMGGNYDHSNSQYALLALKEARRAGVRVDRGVFEKALRHFLSVQERSGARVPRYEEHGGDGVYSRQRRRVPGADRARGWGYVGRSPVTGSMTAAGVAAVAICRSELSGKEYEGLRKRADSSLRDGLAWLGRRFSVLENPGAGANWHYYYLYGLERAGVLGKVVYMGEHRWYAEGARYLVNAQGPDGAWRTPIFGMQPKPDLVDPCFALLFLARATARAAGEITERNLLNLTEAARLSDRDLHNVFLAAFDELLDLEGNRLEDRASDFAFCGPRVLPLLIKTLLDPDEKVRARGILVLEKITGKSFDYDPAANEEEREAAVDRITSWYLSRRKTLALDRQAKQIR